MTCVHTQAAMGPREQALLRAEIGDSAPALVLRSDTRVDTGGWLRKSPLWLCVTGQALVLLAAARRKYVQRIPLSDCTDSRYSHATGQLVIAPTEALRFRHVSMPPDMALRVLRLLNPDQASTASPVSQETENSRA